MPIVATVACGSHSGSNKSGYKFEINDYRYGKWVLVDKKQEFSQLSNKKFYETNTPGDFVSEIEKSKYFIVGNSAQIKLQNKWINIPDELGKTYNENLWQWHSLDEKNWNSMSQDEALKLLAAIGNGQSVSDKMELVYGPHEKYGTNGSSSIKLVSNIVNVDFTFNQFNFSMNPSISIDDRVAPHGFSETDNWKSGSNGSFVVGQAIELYSNFGFSDVIQTLPNSVVAPKVLETDISTINGIKKGEYPSDWAIKTGNDEFWVSDTTWKSSNYVFQQETSQGSPVDTAIAKRGYITIDGVKYNLTWVKN